MHNSRSVRRLWIHAGLLAALGSLSLTGCGDGDDGGAGGDDALATTTRAGHLALPAGSGVAPGDLTVETATGVATPDAEGRFSLRAYADDPLLIMAMSPGGNPMLLAFADAEHPDLDARTTAEVLAYFGIGGFLVAEPADRQRLIGLLREAEELDPLADAIATAVAADPEALVDPDSPVGEAVLAAVAALLADDVGRAVLVQPSDARSGMRVNQVGANSIQMQNEYRRRSHVFVERVSYVPSGGGDPVLSPAALTDFQVPPVTGLKSLASTIVDIVLGNVAYAPVTSEVIALPVEPAGARKTTYKVSVVGAGANAAGDFADMPAGHKAQGALVAAEQLIFDMFLPLVINVLGPNHAGTQQVLDKLRLGGVKGSLIQGFTQAAPDLIRKLQSGDTKGAFLDAYNTFITDGTLRTTVMEAILETGAFVNVITGQPQTMIEAVGKMLGVIKVLDAALQSFDTLTMGVQLGLSNLGDIWTVDVTEPRVRLEPQTASLGPDEEVELSANVPELTGDDIQLVYRWQTEGRFGDLTDGQAGHHNTFESTRRTVTYKAKSAASGTDIVQVEVLQLIVGDAGSQKVSVGTASSTISVGFKAKVDLAPAVTTIEDGTEAVFTATVTPQPQAGSLEYTWRSTTNAGDLVVPVATRAQFESSLSAATYRARDKAEGEDTITVSVVHVLDDARTIVGSDTATVKVQEDLPTQRTEARLLWKGFVPYDQPGLEHLWRWGMIAVFAWDKVPGEDFYDLTMVQQAGTGWSFGDMPGWGPQWSSARYKYHTAAELRAIYPDRGLVLNDDELYYLFPWAPLGGVTQDVDTSEYEAHMAEGLKVIWEVTVTR